MMEDFITKQKEICDKYHIEYIPLPENLMVALAIETIGKMPIRGMRYYTKENENISWYIYCGEYLEKEDFFKPIHIHHLAEMLPEVLPYLALSEGYGFVIDNTGYEDVWFGNYRDK